MNKSQLPQIKKSLKTFILEEDAKIIDKSAVKVTMIMAFMAANIAYNMHSGNAFFSKHEDHADHQNNLNTANPLGTNLHRGTNPTYADVNSIPEKSVLTAHGNHYNHVNEESQNMMMMSIVAFAIVGALAVYMAPAMLLGSGASIGSTALTTTTISSAGITVSATGAGIGVGAVGGAGAGAVAGSLLDDDSSGSTIDAGVQFEIPPDILLELHQENQE